MLFDLRGRMLWFSPLLAAGSTSPVPLLGMRWIEFVDTCDQTRMLRWLVSADTSGGLAFGAINPYNGARISGLWRKLSLGNTRWLVLSESIQCASTQPAQDVDFAHSEYISIEDFNTSEGGGGGGIALPPRINR